MPYEKRTLEYDDVMNKQREVIYGLRSEIVAAEQVREHLYDIVNDVVVSQAELLLGEKPEAEQISQFVDWVNITFPIGFRAL